MGYLDKLLAEHEAVILKAHRHILFVIIHMLPYILLTIGLWIVGGIALARLDGATRTVVAIAAFAASLFTVGRAAYRFLSWQREEYIVTNHRIIQIEGLINKHTFDSALDQINDVEMRQSVFGRIFGYGDIQILTGSDIGLNQLWGIANPFEFKKSLLEAKLRSSPAESLARGLYDAAQASGTDAARLLAALTDLRDSGVITSEEYEQRRRSLLKSG